MSPPAPPTPTTNPRRAFVGTMIALTVLLFIVTSGLLYYRWVTMVEPTCVLIVETAPSLRGAEVQVDGLTLPKPHKVIIGSGERFALPFYLEPGEYSVQVTMAGNTLYDRKVVLTRSAPGLRLDLLALKPLVTTSAPATAPVFTP